MSALSVAVLTLTAPATRLTATVAVAKKLTTPAPLWSRVRLSNSPSEYDLNVGQLVDTLRAATARLKSALIFVIFMKILSCPSHISYVLILRATRFHIIKFVVRRRAL